MIHFFIICISFIAGFLMGAALLGSVLLPASEFDMIFHVCVGAFIGLIYGLCLRSN